MTLRTRFTEKSSRSRRCLMSSAIHLMTCLTIINSRIENSKYLYRHLWFKSLSGLFLWRSTKVVVKIWIFVLLPKQNHSTDWEASVASLTFLKGYLIFLSSMSFKTKWAEKIHMVTIIHPSFLIFWTSATELNYSFIIK